MSWKRTAALLSSAPLFLFGCPPEDSCVARGTWIGTPTGKKLVESLMVGDEVLSFDEETGEPVTGRIVAIKSATRECMKMLTDCGAELVLTSDHIVYSPRVKRYVEAGQWVTGDETEVVVVTDEGLVLTPVRAQALVGVFDVFDLELDTELHNYAANGVLVHNKTFPIYPETCMSGDEEVTEGNRCDCDDGSNGRVACLKNVALCRCEPEPDPEHGLVCEFIEFEHPCYERKCCPTVSGIAPVRGAMLNYGGAHLPDGTYTIGCLDTFDKNPAFDYDNPEEGCYMWPEKGIAVQTDLLIPCLELGVGDSQIEPCSEEVRALVASEPSEDEVD